MREISLKEMQKIELDILLAFDALCKTHDLRYYMDGGTLLGAMPQIQPFRAWMENSFC